MLPKCASPRRVYRNKCAGEYVSKNEPIGWLHIVTLGRRDRRITCAVDRTDPDGSPNAGHTPYATLSVEAESVSAGEDETHTNDLDLGRCKWTCYEHERNKSLSRVAFLSDELDLSLVLGDARGYLYSPVWG